MRIFNKPNLTNNWKCPICGKNEEKEIVLLGIEGTEDGNNIEAEQVHLACLNPIIYLDKKIIAQIF